MQASDWDDLRFVLAAARERSFAGAASVLRVNESTVLRRVARCEARLRATLFERRNGRLIPTGAGADLLRHAERIELHVQAVEDAVGGTDTQVAGRVQVTAVPVIVNHLLAPRLPALLRRHPHLHVDLIAEAADLSLIGREADIALRLARPRREQRALARRIGDVRYGVFAAARRPPESAAWIAYTDSMRFLPQSRWIAEQTAGHPAAFANLRVNDAETLVQAVKAGLGKSFLPVFAAGGDRDLERLDDGTAGWSRELWMMLHPDLADLARIRITADWLSGVVRDRLADHVAAVL